jgi:hypothetical protein
MDTVNHFGVSQRSSLCRGGMLNEFETAWSEIERHPETQVVESLLPARAFLDPLVKTGGPLLFQKGRFSGATPVDLASLGKSDSQSGHSVRA